MKLKRGLKRVLWGLLIAFLLLNISAYMHAWRFTHFSNDEDNKTSDTHLSFSEKVKILFTGIKNPRPDLKGVPPYPFETIQLHSNKMIECWSMKTESSKGTVIIFHGYGGNKYSMLDKAEEFRKMGYSTLLVDFMGSGGSEGNQTTIGYKEALQVKTAFDFLANNGEVNIILFGTSMGAASILRAIYKHDIKPTAIILECPFGSLYKTTVARFKKMGVPSFPMAGLLVFWGGVQNGFWGFSHKPIVYASSVKCPALLLHGEKDEKVSTDEIRSIFKNLVGKKELKLYPNAGHENYLLKYQSEWKTDVGNFLSSIE